MSYGMKLWLWLLILTLSCFLFSCEAALTTTDAEKSVQSEGRVDSGSPNETENSRPSSELEDISAQEKTCTAPNPQGCAELPCEPGYICDFDAECAPSYCSCDKEKDLWLCTRDCLGGTCVPTGSNTKDASSNVEPEPDTPSSNCLDSNPAGCVQTGCPAGRKCDLTTGCAPSSCACDENSGSWSCTEDCGGGVCVPKEALECLEPDPTGCVKTGCEEGSLCDTTKGCTPSECWCDGVTGKWGCTADCGGGVCVPENAKECTTPNPAGCKTTGCKPGQICDLTVGCTPSSCFCDSSSGIWNCTEDCGGGSCVQADSIQCEPGTVSVKLNCVPCNEALEMAKAEFAIAENKYGICDTDEDCIAKSFPSACGPGCPIAINPQWAPLYETFLKNNAPTYCSEFEDNCLPLPPACPSGEAFCSEGQCTFKEGE